MLEIDGLERFSFGGGGALADSLLALVLAGTKTATCWAARHGQLTYVGKRMVACDSAGRPRAVLQTLSLTQSLFRDIDEAFTRAEGEGDLSLGWWRQAHQSFFEREGEFSDGMTLWCEHFRVVEVLPIVGEAAG